jgi:3-deoxy-D-manno-octulosonate 8-phosphate phosphatase (KDO 8-P phosphatase)
MNLFDLLILDIDGVLTNGIKTYDREHRVLSKTFMCKDFTAIKRFTAAGVKVIMISGDEWNRSMAEKRNIDFYCSRDTKLSLDKSLHLSLFEKKYNIPQNKMAFVGDDYFDLQMFEKLKYTFCTSDSPNTIKNHALYVLKSKGGEGVLVELYDIAVQKNWLVEASMSTVSDLDAKELTSAEMK